MYELMAPLAATILMFMFFVSIQMDVYRKRKAARKATTAKYAYTVQRIHTDENRSKPAPVFTNVLEAYENYLNSVHNPTYQLLAKTA